MINEYTTDIETEPTSFRKRKKSTLKWLLIYAALVGGIGAFIPETSDIGQLIDFLVGFPSLILAISWCHYDALERGFSLGIGWKACLLLIFIIAFPAHLFQSRDHGGFRALGLSILFFFAIITTSVFFTLLFDFIGFSLGVLE
jgi:hypothetical protein